MAVLTLKAKHDHLEKVANVRDPVKAVAEFVWNALDADAKHVRVNLLRNALGGVECIEIADDGTGITKERADHDFESLGESWKRTAVRTRELGRVVHGKEGQGRLKFFSLTQKAHWKSIYRDAGGLSRIDIHIDAGRLHTSSVSDPVPVGSEESPGTVVSLTHLKQTLDFLGGEQARSDFSSIFAPYVMQYPGVVIEFDGHVLDPNKTVERKAEFPVLPVFCPNRVVEDLSIRVIEWKAKQGNRRIHLGGESGVVLGSQPANVTAPGFDFSVYAYAPFFQEIAKANLLELEGLNDPDFAAVLENIRERVGDYFRGRQTEQATELIQGLKDAGVYPYEGEPKDEIERRERQVFDIATHAVSSYSRDFKKADNPLKKITLGLLREAVSHNPESLSRILRAVFNLPKTKQDEFSDLLERTELGNIISASTLVADRVVVLKVLREIVFEPKHRASVKERGELDVLVRDNTWLFGENFHFTMAEVGLTKVMNRVAEELALKRNKAKVRKRDGKVGRVDSFLGRVIPHPETEHREFLLVELKRPSLVVGREELDQLEDYVNALLAQPDYINTSTFWNFFLVTTEYDDVVKERVTQKDRQVGVFLDKPNHRVWVKTWAELVRECEGRLDFIQKKLQVEVSATEIEERIAQLKAVILKAEVHSETLDGTKKPA